MPKKFYFFIFLIIIIFIGFIGRVIYISYGKREYYIKRREEISEIYVKGSSAPRGRILDINGKVIVDNIGVNTIIYHKSSNISTKDELSIAKKLAEYTSFKYSYNKSVLKDYYMILYPDITSKLITEEEYQLYNERKISKDDLYNLKIERITDDMLSSLTEEEKYSSRFYYLMNDGYSYQNKELLSDISDAVYASILEANMPGIFGEIKWKRNYLYGDTLRTVLGSISNSLPFEKSYLLNEGYSYQDKVGISGLEEYYEEYLKGEAAIYKVLGDNSLKLVREAKRGNDLVLEIDISLQQKVEEIIKKQIIEAKKTPNTEFYKESYALISDPFTGSIKAAAGIRLNTGGKEISFSDVSINVIKNAYTMGSAVKGASISVGYLNNIIDIGTTMIDSCVKLYSQPAKCSFMPLGRVNDLTALTNSSNYYQFIIALSVAGNKYTYNMKAKASLEDFNTYRNVFAEYGLGVKTGIDLMGEATGLKGSKIAPDLLMNLAIGQYDLYTPASLLQYTNTIANGGERLKLSLMHSIKMDEEVIVENKKQVLNKISLEEKYLKRIQAGFHDVIKHGTGYYYVSNNLDAAGKTGTSESYIDNNYDGIFDAYVVSNTFLMYAPFDNPKYSMVVISPNTSNLNGKSEFRSGVNRLIARNISDLLFTSS